MFENVFGIQLSIHMFMLATCRRTRNAIGQAACRKITASATVLLPVSVLMRAAVSIFLVLREKHGKAGWLLLARATRLQCADSLLISFFSLRFCSFEFYAFLDGTILQ